MVSIRLSAYMPFLAVSAGSAVLCLSVWFVERIGATPDMPS